MRAFFAVMTVSLAAAPSAFAGAPPKPTGLSVDARYAHAELIWNGPGAAVVDKYQAVATSGASTVNCVIQLGVTACDGAHQYNSSWPQTLTLWPALANGKTWSVKLRAHNAQGWSPYTASKSVKPTAAVDCTKYTGAFRNVAGCNLSNKTLTSFMYGLRAVGTDFSKSYMFGANLERADLSTAVMRGANLGSISLAGANLTSANLSGFSNNPSDMTNLTGASFVDANLTNANLNNSWNGQVNNNYWLWPGQITGATFSNTTCANGSNSSTNGQGRC
jgi:Pentapeptide repeats (8 copies)